LTGAADVNTRLAQYPNANYFLLMYGHNDASAQRPSGLGLTPQNPGYAGSFKDFMQRIIAAVRAAGKVALIAKHSAVFPLDSPMNMAVQQYNQVIDELYANPANGITVVPPDFYTYFSTRRATHYWNDVEMNGLGYQSMAQFWLEAILAAP
jgi:lysophospholipase L1-like esterase